MVEYPSDWKVAKLGEVANCLRGVGYSADNDLYCSESEHTIRLLRSNNILDGEFLDEDVQYVNRRCASDEQILVKGDIMVCMANGSKLLVGKSCLFRKEFHIPYTFGAFMSCVRIKADAANPLFVSYLLKSEQYWRSIGLALAGSSINNLNKNHILDLSFAFPPLPEQKRIAKALDDVDRLIENLGKRIAKKRLIKKGIAQELLTGKKRLPGFEGSWKMVKLGEIGIFSKGAGISRAESNTGNLPAVRYGELYTDHNDCLVAYRSRISKEVASKSKLTKQGDVVFTASGETAEEIGKSVSILEEGVYAGGDLIIWSPHEKTDAVFWGYLLNLPYVQKQKTLAAQGATIVHVRASSLADIEVSVPALPEQRAIAKVLSDMDAEIANLEARQAKLKLVKKGMLQDLLTGKVRLKG